MPLPELQRCLHHPARVEILILLQARGPLSFPILRDDVGLTDGNLNRHLKQLLDAGWVASRREGLGRGSVTTLEVTAAGRRGLASFRNWCLEAVGRVDGDGTPEGSAPESVEGPADPAARVVVDDRSRHWAD